MSACVPMYRILELVNGELEPERVRAVLDHAELCRDCSAAIDVLVTLKANREVALEALRAAEAHDRAAGMYDPPTWAVSGLRLAVGIAIVGAALAWWLLWLVRA